MVSVIGISDLDIIWNLELVIWDLRSSGANYLHPSEGNIAKKNGASI